MRKFFLLVAILIMPISLAVDCSTRCIESGFSSGMCTTKCNDVKVAGADDCKTKGEALMLIGTESVNTYADGDKFIEENEEDPEWIWIIKNIRTKTATNVLDTDNDAQHSGPIIGVKNNFIATDIDAVGVKAKKTGESFCLPNNVFCIKLNALTVTEYGTFTIQKTTVDLSSFNSSWTNKATILINSVDDANGLKMQTAGYDAVASGADGTTTDKVWIIYNNTGSYAGVFYEDASNAKKLAGYLNMDNANDDINIADVNYKKTLDTRVQIDLRNTFATQDALDIVLDILGTEGTASTNGNDDITINLKHSADSDFVGFGNSSGTADDADLVWVSTNIGTKDEDHRSRYGIIIKDPKANNAQDRVELEIPADQVKATVEITRKSISVTESEAVETTLLGEVMPSPKLASELKLREDYDLIFVGGPCANPLVEEFEGFPTCSEWPLEPGEAMIKFVKNKNNIAMLVAGTMAEDTKMATEFLKNYENYDLEGTYIKLRNKKPEVMEATIEGIDFSDYPVPFIKDGKFQKMLLIVGDNAKGSDTIGAQDVASGLFSETRKTITNATETQETETTDTSTKKDIPLGNNLGDATFFSKSLDKGNIKSMLSGNIDFSGKDYDYEEILMLYGGGPTIHTSLTSSDDLYKSDVYMEATAGSIRYYHVFEETIDMTAASANTPLTINLLDNELSITDAETATKFKSQTATKYFMRTGDKVTVSSKEVELIDIDKEGAVRIKINNTEEIIYDEKYQFINDLIIKNVKAFDTEGAECCCSDLLSGLF